MTTLIAPYASIILPTHDRAETLPLALTAALEQTVHDIEILVVGDGCTPQVREAVESFSRKDGRIRFLDLAKAPLRGAANRHHAVTEAHADRIFYTDDDDLMLPHHVETLGKALDRADVVDTPAATIHLDGSVLLGLQNSSYPPIREMLNAEQHKGVFDTHLAHRRSSYLNGSGAWLQSSDRRVVLHMLKAFAQDPNIVWQTLPRVTALSFHGMCRFGMPATERVSELKTWHRAAGEPNIENKLVSQGSYAFHGMTLINALARTGHRNDLDEIEGWHHQGFERDNLAATVRTLASLIAGTASDDASSASVVDDLLDARLDPYLPTFGVIQLLLRSFMPDVVRGLLSRCRDRAALPLAYFHLGVQTGTPTRDELSSAESAFEMAPDCAQFFFGVAIIQGFAHMRDYQRAWEWTQKLRPRAAVSFHAAPFWRWRESLATQLGRPEDAEFARQQHEAVAKLNS